MREPAGLGTGFMPFALWTTNIHMALQAGDIPLSRGMQNLSFRYTRWINHKKKRTGHLFQGRYKALLVDGFAYLLELVRYIHLNPVRSGIVVSPDDYPWSGHLAYLGKESLPWLTTDWILAQYSERVDKARELYSQFLRDGLAEEHRPEFHRGAEDSRILGDDRFMERCLAPEWKPPVRVELEDIVTAVCRVSV